MFPVELPRRRFSETIVRRFVWSDHANWRMKK